MRGLRILAVLALAPAAAGRAHDGASPNDPSGEWDVAGWTLRHGLPQLSVNAIVRDDEGALWLGTFGGLVRFDGRRFRVLDSGSTVGLPTNRVVSLAVAADGTMWCGGAGGEVFGMRDGAIRAGRAPEGRRGVTLVAPGADGSVVAAINDDLLAWQPDRDAWTLVHVEPRRQAWRMVRAAGDGSIWAASDARVVRVDPATGGVDAIERASPWRMPTLVVDAARTAVHVLDAHGLATFAAAGGRPRAERVWADGEGARLATLDERGGLVVVFDEVLARLEPGTIDDPARALHREEIETPPTSMRALLVDDDGQIWCGHQYDGLRRVRRRQVRSPVLPADLRGVECRSIVEDDEGRLIIGFADRGLAWAQTDEWVRRPELWIVRAIARLGDGRWLASANEDVVELDGDTRPVVRRSPGLGRIFDLLPEADGSVLVAADRGLARLVDDRVVPVPLPGPPAAPITALQRDGASLWIGGDGACWRVRDGVVERFGVEEGMPRSAVRCFLALGPDLDLVGTYGGGIVAIRDGALRRLAERDGLPENVMSDLQLDRERGHVWALGNRGAYRFPADDFAAFARGDAGPPRVLSFREADGMGEGNPGRPGSLLRDDGSVIFATLTGPRTIAPMERPAAPSTVRVARVRVDGYEVEPVDGRVELDVDAGRIELSLGCVNLTMPGSTHFEARLAGRDERWIRLGDDQDLVFDRIPPGAHAVEVRAAIGDGPWSAPTPALVLVRPAAFGESVLASVLAVGGPVAVLLAFGAALRRRHRVRLRAVHARLHQKAAAHARERRLREELDHRVRNNLSSVLGLLALHRRGDFWTAGPRGPRLEDRVRAMAEVHALLSRRAWSPVPLSSLADGIAARVATAESFAHRGADPVIPARQCQALALALHELASNASEHGAWRRDDGRVELAAELADGDRCRLVWRETSGAHAAAALVPGTGLGLVRGFVEADLHGRFELRMEAEGLVATIEFPLVGRDPDAEITRP